MNETAFPPKSPGPPRAAFIILAVIVVFVGFIAWGLSDASATQPVSGPAPNFTLTLFDGYDGGLQLCFACRLALAAGGDGGFQIDAGRGGLVSAAGGDGGFDLVDFGGGPVRAEVVDLPQHAGGLGLQPVAHGCVVGVGDFAGGVIEVQLTDLGVQRFAPGDEGIEQ